MELTHPRSKQNSSSAIRLLLCALLTSVAAVAASGCLDTSDETALPTNSGTFYSSPSGSDSPLGNLKPSPMKPDAGTEAGKCVPKLCSEVGNPCGEVPDECGGKITCSPCFEGLTCGGGGFNICGVGACTPTTCAKAKATCGAISDGCGHVLQCGTCGPDSECNKNQCSCVPTTCEKAGATCGSISDGCGQVLNCGTCAPGKTCNQNQCSCVPTTCAAAGASCGSISDGCGKTLDCGTCTPGHACTNNVCVCTPTTCAQAGAQCGSVSDGCGGTLNCGGCGAGKNCVGNTCCNNHEICGNGVDDNCDGQKDEDCSEACETTEGHNCNGDGGYGDHCDPSENTNGCSDEKFWAWCNRKNPAHPDIWDNYLKQWVDDHCDGTITLEDPNGDGYPTFLCTDSNGKQWGCTTPLVLSFAPKETVRFAPARHSFELAAGVFALDWPTAATPWLALDRNHNGTIDGASELFGNTTQAHNGFEALAELDSNHDGLVDPNDCAWGQLLLWRDANADGVSQPSELSSAASEGLLGVSLNFAVVPRCDGRGNCERERAEFRWLDGGGELHVGSVIDVYLRSETRR